MRKFFLATAVCSIVMVFSLTEQANAQWGRYRRGPAFISKRAAWDYNYHVRDAWKRYATPVYSYGGYGGYGGGYGGYGGGSYGSGGYGGYGGGSYGSGGYSRSGSCSR